MAQPTQLTPTEQDALVKQIGLAMLRVAPDSWEQLTVDYRAVGRYSEATGKVVYTDGSSEPWTMPPDLQGLFARLRGGMYREGRGTWFNARYRLDHPSSYNLEYDREEPDWERPPPPQAYPDDMRMFPRTDENVPPWLRRRLSSAPPPPRFRVARIFDGPGPVVNRPPVPAEDVHELLEYLDGAPLAGPARGYDVDRMDPEGRQSVPVAFHTDGSWIWPAAVNYYLREHDVPPEPELVEHVARLHFDLPLLDDSVRSAAAAFLGPGPAGPPGPPGPGGHGGPGGPRPPGPAPTRAMPVPAGPPPGPPAGPPAAPAPVVPPDSAGSAPAAALPSQGPPEETVDALRSRLADLGVPESAFRIGPPTGRAWTMEETDGGWRVGWFDRAFVAPAVFEDVADASAFLLGKLMMDADRRQGFGPVHVVPARHPMVGDRVDEDVERNALGADEPVRPSEELEIPQPMPMAAGRPDYGRGEGFGPPGGFAAPPGGFAAPEGGFAAPEGGFGPPGGGFGPSVGFEPPDAEPDLGRHGRHDADRPEYGRHDADRPGNGHMSNGHPDAAAFTDASAFTEAPGYPQPSPSGFAPDYAQPEATAYAPPDAPGFGPGYAPPDGSGFTPPGGHDAGFAQPEGAAYGHEEAPDHGQQPAGRRARVSQPDGFADPEGDPGQRTRIAQPPGFADPEGDPGQHTRVVEPQGFTDPGGDYDQPGLGAGQPGRPGHGDPDVGRGQPEGRGFGQPEPPPFGRPQNPVDATRPDALPASPRSGAPELERTEFAPPEFLHGDSPRPAFGRPDPARGGPDTPRPAPGRGDQATTVAPPPAARPAAAPASGEWPISPLPGEPPLTLFRGKRLVELEPGTEIDRFGEDDGNLVYAVGTPFSERSLVPEWVDRPYHAYRVRQPVQVLTGAAIPWFDQPGGGTAYLLPDAIGELVALGRLVEINGRERPPA